MGRKVTSKAPMPSGTRVLYTAQQGPQEAFFQSQAEEVLYGGAAGGGKSYGLRAIAVTYCLEHPGATVALFRRTFRELEDTHILMLQQELPSSLVSYKASTHDFRFDNGSILMCRFAEKEVDVYSYDTFEADLMLFDELSAFSEFQYSYLLTRCRSTKPWWPGRRIRSATNPGNVGHLWIKRRFIDYLRPYEEKRAPRNEGGMLRQFIPAKVTDNKILMTRDPAYIDVLRGLPEAEYRAKALGDWSIFSGQFFGKWRESLHVIDPFEIPQDWLHYVFVDWGVASPHAVYWAARPPSTNTLFIYREQYGAGVPTREQAKRAADKTNAARERLEFIVGDPSMWAKEQDADGHLSMAQIDYWKEAFPGIEVMKGNNERVMGASLFREYLDWQGVEAPGQDIQVVSPPKLKFFRTCENAIRTIPALVHSTNNVEDVDTDGEDHAFDAIKYGLRALFSAPARPRAVNWIDTPQGLVVLPSRGG